MDLMLIKLANGTLAPADEASNEELAKVKTGAQMHGTFTRQRKYWYHQRFFALVSYAFDLWTELCPPVEYRGEVLAPNKDRFRKDITILAGYYESTFRLNGEIRIEAKSISFASMDQAEVEALYSSVINVILTKVLTNRNITEQALRDHVDRVLAFDR